MTSPFAYSAFDLSSLSHPACNDNIWRGQQMNQFYTGFLDRMRSTCSISVVFPSADTLMPFHACIDIFNLQPKIKSWPKD